MYGIAFIPVDITNTTYFKGYVILTYAGTPRSVTSIAVGPMGNCPFISK
jgi:hypothetical protein